MPLIFSWNFTVRGLRGAHAAEESERIEGVIPARYSTPVPQQQMISRFDGAHRQTRNPGVIKPELYADQEAIPGGQRVLFGVRLRQKPPIYGPKRAGTRFRLQRYARPRHRRT
jgi:hypothetical protein